MRRRLAVGLCLFLGVLSVCALSYARVRKADMPFYVYKDHLARENHYIPSGWMGDYGAIRIKSSWQENVHSGKHCMRWQYTGQTPQGAGWAGVYWQNPANNWGRVEGGFDLTGASSLSFWARGDKGGEVIEFKMGGIAGEYSDSDEASTGPVSLSTEWKRYTIDLKDADLSYIAGGFCWVASKMDNPDGVIFYLDDIVYEKVESIEADKELEEAISSQADILPTKSTEGKEGEGEKEPVLPDTEFEEREVG